MANAAFLLDLAEELRRVVEPLERALSSEQAFAEFLQKFGWDVDAAGLDISEVQDALAIVADTSLAADLVRDIFTPQDETEPIETFVELIGAGARVIGRIRTVADVPAPTGLSAELWESLTADVLNSLLAEYLDTYQPLLFLLFLLLGILEEEKIENPGANRIPHTRWHVHWDRLLTALSDPAQLMREVYAWDDPNEPLRYELLLDRVARCARYARLPAEVGEPAPEVLAQYYSLNNPRRSAVQQLRVSLLTGVDVGGSLFDFSLCVLPIPLEDEKDAAPAGVLVFHSVSMEGQTLPTALLWPFSLELSGFFRSESGVQLAVFPGGVTPVLRGLDDTTVDADLAIIAESLYPLVLIGSRLSHRLQTRNWKARLHVAGRIADPEIELEIAFDRLELIIEDFGVDGFLETVFGVGPHTAECDLAIVWSSKSGLHFRGQGGLGLSWPLNLDIGLATLQALNVGIAVAQAEVGVSVGVSAHTHLGPVQVTVENVGVTLTLAPVAANQPAGIFGDLDLSFDFKPPDGLGVLVDAGAITGSGFLTFDPANARYGGMLQLEVYGFTVSAIGLLDTRLPGGEAGFSFLLIVSTEFTPIQLGFGFTLNGVGGLAGIHRTIVVDALQAGIRSGRVEGVLFPDDPLRNAPQLISDLRTYFPPAANRYVFGPMALIGWGTPTLLEAKLGIILEVPDPVRLVLLGQLSAHFPTKEAAIVELHVDVLGVLDFGQKQLAIDARLHDSRVAIFALSGDFALRLAWGDHPLFVMSLGGFHPRFPVPPAFPALQRLTIALGLDENPRISLQAYLALTSNSLQLGAKAELLAEAGDFSLYGWITFDALVIFSPLYFIVDFSAGVALRWDGDTIAGVHVNATLEGPAPWHAWGEACLSLLFFDICVDFDARFGDERRTELPRSDPWPALQAAIQDARNWSAQLPPAAFRVVTVAAPESTPPVLVDPIGRLTLQQSVVPLNRAITKFGETAPTGPGRYDIRGVTIGDEPVEWAPVRAAFAAGQFTVLSDDEKLSRPGFEPMDAGATLASEAATHGPGIRVELEYETVIVDSPWESRTADVYRLPQAHQRALLEGGAAARAPLRRTGLATFAPDPREPRGAALAEDLYVVASTVDLRVRADITGPTTPGHAAQVLREYLAAHPDERDALQVLPGHEVAEAA